MSGIFAQLLGQQPLRTGRDPARPLILLSSVETVHQRQDWTNWYMALLYQADATAASRGLDPRGE
ncbi:MAG: hypothetical protein ABI427_20030 [Solirubrobacteraceae bacterium]